MEIVLKAMLGALVLTVISFFRGGVRYPFEDNVVAPIWFQLAGNFVIYWIACICLMHVAAKRRKK